MVQVVLLIHGQRTGEVGEFRFEHESQEIAANGAFLR